MEFSIDKDVQKSKVLPPPALPSDGFTVVLEMCPSAAVVLSPCNKSDSLSFIPPQVVFASKDPVWEEGFTFFVHNVKTQQLIVQVCEKKRSYTHRKEISQSKNIVKRLSYIKPQQGRPKA